MFLGLTPAAIAARVAPYALIALAVLAGWLYVRDLQSKAAQIPALRAEIAAEKQARERDVAGLTALAAGLTAAKSATTADQHILEATLDAKAPQPVSPGLSRFIECLRATDQGKQCAASAGAGPAAPAHAAGP